MAARTSKADTGFGVSFIVSTVIHLTVFLSVIWYGSHRQPLKLEQTYYVDVVNLPVAAPRAGSPTQQGNDTLLPPAPAPGPAVPMASPAGPKPPAKKPEAAKPAPPNKPTPPASEPANEFAERIARMERAAEARQAEIAMARLREKVGSQGSGRAGTPAGTGSEAGSDYLAYVKSRLKDAFQRTITYTTANPEMTVRIFIDSDGKLSRKKTERSSGDRAFEISVLRAIDAASEKFTPPPGRRMFEAVFVFKPEGIVPNRP